MPARLEVIKAISGQRIYFYPQQGRPSATPSVEIKDQYGSTVTASATSNVTQDSVNTTVSVAGAKGDTSLTLASVSGIEFRKTYLITNSLLQTEWVRVYSVNSSTKVVEFDEPLEFTHDTSATFVSTMFYRTLQSGEVDSLEELYRARASYVVDSMTYVQEIPFDVVLTPLVNPLTVEYIKKRRPGVMRREPSSTRGSDLADLREAAWDEVMKGIRGHKDGWRPALLKTPDDIEQWALAEFDKLAWEAGITTVLRGEWAGIDAIEHLENKISRLANKSLVSLKFMDLSDDDSRADDEIEYQRPDFSR
jgi:hypothetical protein